MKEVLDDAGTYQLVDSVHHLFKTDFAGRIRYHSAIQKATTLLVLLVDSAHGVIVNG